MYSNFQAVTGYAATEVQHLLIGVGAVALVVLAFVCAAALRQRGAARSAMRERACWGEVGYAEARTSLLETLAALSNGQLHDVKRQDLARASGLGYHFKSVLTLAKRAGFLEEELCRAGWKQRALATVLKDPDLATAWYVRFSEVGLQTFKASAQAGTLVGPILGTGLTVTLDGEMQQVTIIETMQGA